eukprot:357302-Chlamydomonas_euryale.AAC.1
MGPACGPFVETSEGVDESVPCKQRGAQCQQPASIESHSTACPARRVAAALVYCCSGCMMVAKATGGRDIPLYGHGYARAKPVRAESTSCRYPKPCVRQAYRTPANGSHGVTERQAPANIPWTERASTKNRRCRGGMPPATLHHHTYSWRQETRR